MDPLITTTNALHQQITRIETTEIGEINSDIEQARLKIRALGMDMLFLPARQILRLPL